jgi:hypothetical protein
MLVECWGWDHVFQSQSQAVRLRTEPLQHRALTTARAQRLRHATEQPSGIMFTGGSAGCSARDVLGTVTTMTVTVRRSV